MGNEVTHVRISDLESFRLLFEAGGADPEAASFAGSLVSKSVNGTSQLESMDPTWRPLATFLQGMVQSVEVEYGWLLDLDRRFDWLAFSMERAASGADALVGSSVFGDAEFTIRVDASDHVVRGGQGFAQRFTSPARCRAVAEFLDGLSAADVRNGADLAAMANEGVYKAHASGVPDEVRSLVVQDFEGLRALYRDVASAGHGVLITRD